jgi:hypothetical protein
MADHPAPVNGALVANPEAPEARPDATVATAADWLIRLRSAALGWLSSDPDDLPATEGAPVAPDGRTALARGDDLREEGRVEQASIGAPVVVGVAAAVAVRYHDRLRGWLSRRRGGPEIRRTGARPSGPWRGPHRRF